MPPLPLPENASLEHLKSQAKLAQDLVRAGDEGGLDLVVEFHPRVSDRSAIPSPFKRADAQLVVARLYGFASWTALRDYLKQLDDVARPDTADNEPTEPADVFVALACVSYGEVDVRDRLRRATEMLAADPALGEAHLAAMAIVGSHQRVAELLAQSPGLVNEPCGPNRWSPLLYCAYSRMDEANPEWSTLETARVLLDAGAHPNAGFLWRGLVPPFTALTGAFGHGEQDQPPHQNALALARLLLEAGADPNDGQALYNNGLGGSARDDAGHLELLVEFGLGSPQGGPWYERMGKRLTPPEKLLTDELEVAAHRGLPRRMRFLANLGLDLTSGVGRSGQTPRQLATNSGHTEVLAVLEEFGV